MIRVLVVAVPVLIAGFYAMRAVIVTAKAKMRPSTELAKAVRCLDRILAYDDNIATLSTELRNEAQKITQKYYKELNE